ncbi:MAG: NUDIX hydrolase [Synergistaceae bacterium]|nr:NUDIX hydrolase [Synergistaceae bacterium]
MPENNSVNPLRNIVKTEYPYKGHILDLRVDHVKFPSGSLKVREVVEHRSAVALLAVNEAGKICLVSQYRHAIDADILEIPAGLVEAGEDPDRTAVRELQEETGFKPSKLIRVMDFYSTPGFSTEAIILYYASNLSVSKLPEDDDEFIDVFWFTPAEIAKKISDGKIKDSKTLLAYYWYCSLGIELCR